MVDVNPNFRPVQIDPRYVAAQTPPVAALNNNSTNSLQRLRTNYDRAQNGIEKGKYIDAIVAQSASIIMKTNPQNQQDLIVAVMRFMQKEMDFNGEYNPDAGHGAHNWGGGQALAESHLNGCVEAAKCFQVLYNECAKQNSQFLECFFQNSACVDQKAEQDSSPGGHALAVVFIQGYPRFIDATCCEYPVFSGTQKVSQEELARDTVFKNVCNDIYTMAGNLPGDSPDSEVVHTYVLYGQLNEYASSDDEARAATITARKQYENSK